MQLHYKSLNQNFFRTCSYCYYCNLECDTMQFCNGTNQHLEKTSNLHVYSSRPLAISEGNNWFCHSAHNYVPCYKETDSNPNIHYCQKLTGSQCLTILTWKYKSPVMKYCVTWPIVPIVQRIIVLLHSGPSRPQNGLQFFETSAAPLSMTQISQMKTILDIMSTAVVGNMQAYNKPMKMSYDEC
jgi:hypothetical protein